MSFSSCCLIHRRLKSGELARLRVETKVMKKTARIDVELRTAVENALRQTPMMPDTLAGFFDTPTCADAIHVAQFMGYFVSAIVVTSPSKKMAWPEALPG